MPLHIGTTVYASTSTNTFPDVGLAVLKWMIFHSCCGPRCPPTSHHATNLWGYAKDTVIKPPLPLILDELKQRICATIDAITSDVLQWIWDELDYRPDVCRVTRGSHIKHLWRWKKTLTVYPSICSCSLVTINIHSSKNSFLIVLFILTNPEL